MTKVWRFLLSLLLLAAPEALQAQFIITTNGPEITITGHQWLPSPCVIPPFVTSIGANVFEGTMVDFDTFPDSLRSIGALAFAACATSGEMAISANVTNIGPGAFADCIQLQAINVNPNNPNYCSVDGVLFDKAQGTILCAPGNFHGAFGGALYDHWEIPGSVTNIDYMAFAGSRLSSLVIPDGVLSIGDWAFWSFRATDLRIPDSVVSIGEAAFVNASLTNVTLPSGIGSIGYAAFAGNWLSQIDIPNSVTNIGASAFRYNQLLSLTIPDRVQSIGANAFYANKILTTVTVGAGVSSIGDAAFAACSNLAQLYFYGDAPSAGTNLFAGDPLATAYYLPGASGWGETFHGIPATLWRPSIEMPDTRVGLDYGEFWFKINWATGQVFVVEACSNLTQAIWKPIQTNTIVNGSVYFSEPLSPSSASRHYRVRSL